MTKGDAFNIWLNGIGIIFIGCFTGRSYRYIFDGNSFYSLSFIWFIALYFVFYLIISKFCKNLNIVGILFTVMILAMAIGEITFAIIPDKYSSPVETLFTGISVFTRTAEDKDGNPVDVFEQLRLYSNDDDQLNIDYEKMWQEHEQVSVSHFIFWQSGYNSGFQPVNISKFKQPTNAYEYIENGLTIGPVVIFEIILVCLYRYSIPIVIVCFFFQYKYRKSHQPKPYWTPFFNYLIT